MARGAALLSEVGGGDSGGGAGAAGAGSPISLALARAVTVRPSPSAPEGAAGAVLPLKVCGRALWDSWHVWRGCGEVDMRAGSTCGYRTCLGNGCLAPPW